MILTHTLESIEQQAGHTVTHWCKGIFFLWLCVCAIWSKKGLLLILLLQFFPWLLYTISTTEGLSRKEKAQKKITVILLSYHRYYLLHYTTTIHTDFDTKFLSSHWPHYKSCHSTVLLLYAFSSNYSLLPQKNKIFILNLTVFYYHLKKLHVVYQIKTPLHY